MIFFTSKKVAICCVLLLFSIRTVSQVNQFAYPVETRVNIAPPFSPYLSDYTLTGRTNIFITLSDPVRATLQVKIGLEITNTLTSAKIVTQNEKRISATLSKNVPTSINLSQLFDINNLIGQDLSKLKEEVYLFNVVVYDALDESVRLSNPNLGMQIVNIKYGQPPLLNLPINYSNVHVMPVQNILFQWMPMHLQSFMPNGLPLVYKLRVIELDQTYTAANAAAVVRTQELLNNTADKTYPEVVNAENLLFPYYQLNQLNFLLKPGRVYGWQVVISGANSNPLQSYFSNQGRSEVFVFKYVSECPRVTGASLKLNSGGINELYWPTPIQPNIENEVTGYQITYTPTDGSGSVQSFDFNPVGYTQANTYLMDMLAPNKYYSVSIKTTCKTNSSDLVYISSVKNIPTACNNGPQQIVVEDVSGQKKITWEQVTGAQYYFLQQSTDNGTTWTNFGSQLTTNTTTIAPSGNTFRVVAHCSNGDKGGLAFKINVTGYQGECLIPVPLSFTAAPPTTTGNPYVLTWQGASFYQNYTFQYREKGQTNWVSPNPTVNKSSDPTRPSVSLNLTANKVYEYQITFTCNATKNITTDIASFSTTQQVPVVPPTGDCFPPAHAVSDILSSTSAEVSWDKVESVSGYELSYAHADSLKAKSLWTWTAIKDITNTRKKLTLNPGNATYAFVIKSVCGSLASIPSDTFSFNLKQAPASSNCATISSFDTTEVGKNQFSIVFNRLAAHTSYQVRYHDIQDPVTIWHIKSVTSTSLPTAGQQVKVIIDNLKPGNSYEVEIQPYCEDTKAPKSTLKTFRTRTALVSKEENFQCGKTEEFLQPDMSTCGQKALGSGMTFYAADFEIIVDPNQPAFGQRANGTGSFLLPMANYGEAKVKLINVEIDTSRRMCRGQVQLESVKINGPLADVINDVKNFQQKLTDGLNQVSAVVRNAEVVTDASEKYFAGGDDVGFVKTGELNPMVSAPSVKGTTDVKHEQNNSVVKLPDGTSQNTPVIIKGENNAIYQADSKGNVTKVGTKLAQNPSSSDLSFNLSKGSVRFIQNKESPYDLDEWQSAFKDSRPVDREYESITNSNSTIRVASQFISPNERTVVTAQATGTLKIDDITFVTAKGVQYEKVKINETTCKVLLAGGPHGDAQEVYAIYNGTTKNAVGKLLVPSYEQKSKNLKLIPVGKATVNAALLQHIQDTLNSVYNRVGMAYTVSVADPFTETDWDFTKDGVLQDNASSTFSNDYTGEERALVQSYLDHVESTPDPNTAYMFVLDEAKSSQNDLYGKMPHQEQFGFLFVKGSTVGNSTQQVNPKVIAYTVAHELGHGAHFFDHPFVDYIGLKPEQTTCGMLKPNIMDYCLNRFGKLYKYQWDMMHDPGHIWGVFKRDKDAQIVAGTFYYMPTGVPIVFNESGSNLIDPKGIDKGTLINGALYGFEINGIQYKAVLSGGKFFGYYVNGARDAAKPTANRYQNITKYTELVNGKQKKKVCYINYAGSCKVDFYYATHNFDGHIADDVTVATIGEDIVTTITDVRDPSPFTSGKIQNCEDPFDEDGTLAEGSIGKDFYDHYDNLLSNPASVDKLKKIGNIINKIGPNAYEHFVKQLKALGEPSNYALLDWWFLLYQKPTTQISDATLTALYTKINAFEDAVYNLKYKKFASADEFVAFCNTSFLEGGSAAKWLYTGAFIDLTATRRAELLTLFQSKKASDITNRATVSANIEEEEVVLAIITTLPSAQSKDMVDYFLTSGQRLFSILVQGFADYELLEDTHLPEFVNALTNQVIEAYPAPNEFTAGYDPSAYLNTTDQNYIFFDSDFCCDKERESITETGLFSFEISSVFERTIKYNVSGRLNEYILCRFKNQVNLGGAVFEANRRYKLPAIMLFGLFVKDTRQKIITSGKLAFDAASLAFGVGELNAAIRAARWTQAIIAGADIAVGFGEIVVDNLFQNEIKKTFPNFYEKWLTISTAHGVFEGATGALEAVYGSTLLEAKWFSKYGTDANQRTTAGKIYSKLSEEPQYAEFINDIDQGLMMTRSNLGSFAPQLEDVVVDRIKNKFTSDQITTLRADLNAQLVEDFNKDPRKLDDWLITKGFGKIVDELTEKSRKHIQLGEVKVTVVSSSNPNIILEGERIRTPLDAPFTVPRKAANIEIDVVGIHFESVITNNPNVYRIKTGTKTKVGTLPSGEEIFEVNLEVNVPEMNNGTGGWKRKLERSTLWPESWSEQKIWIKISEAFDNRVYKYENLWTGTTADGIKVEMRLGAGNEILTAYIVF